MSEEDQTVDVTALPKFDMPSYESKMTTKDVKSLALRHGIPLDLHPVALTEGWTMDKLPDDMIDGFSMRDVEALTERVIDLRSVLSGLLFQGGLATTYDYPGFRPIFKDTEGNVVTMSEYLCFPFLSGASISKGPALSSQDHIPQHTTCPLPEGQNIPDKKDHQRRVRVEDPKIVATRERKARAAAKKREIKKQGGDGREGSRPKTKQRKTTGHMDGHVASEATSSLKPLRTLKPHQPSGALAATAELRKNRSPPAPPRDSANRSVHNYSDDHRDEETDDLNLGSSGANVAEGELSREGTLYVPGWSIHQRCRVDNPMWCRELMVHLAPPTAQEELNALNNATALERAWFSLARGSILERELSQANRDQVLRIKELEVALAQKDSALVYAERINAEQAQKKERLVSQVGRAEMEKFDCVHKLLPTVEDILELMGRMEGFDVNADTKMRVEYAKLFERRYPYVEKISRCFCHFVSDLLKVYLDSSPREQVPPHKPSSEKAPSTSVPPGS
uniref:Transposase (Putative), gypsy type n=1 Tax=Tanacetum cinerariifolium TaxID=118510 RepID=A0A6L2NEH2_TANCI|nr:hypothetical protein [Tanacetum cinerariifolium]